MPSSNMTLRVPAWADRSFPTAGLTSAFSQPRLSMSGKSLLIGMLLLVVFWSSDGRRAASSTELLGASAVSVPTQVSVPCSVTPNSGQQGQTVPVTITLGPAPAVNQIITLLLLASPQQVLNATTISFQPGGVQAALLQVAAVPQLGQVRYTGILIVASDATPGPRNMMTRVVWGETELEMECSRAFTVTGGGPTTFFNGPPVFTLPIESPSEPSCGCRTEPTYSHGIGQVETPEACGIKSDGVNRSTGTGAQAIGIKQDGVNRSTGTGAQAIGIKQDGVNWGIKQDAGFATVFLHNGEFNHYVVDLEIPGRGFNWKFERKYRSGVTFDGPLGANWEFNYNRRLFVEAGGAVTRMDGYGRGDRYEPSTAGRFTSPGGFYTRLVRNSDGTYTERDRSGTMATYARPNANGLAFMTSLTDRDGNTMRFTYNTRGQLTQVLDTLGRPIEYRYNNQNRLTEVRDFLNRSIKFEYDNNGDLVAVTSPAVTGTPNGNDFPQGKTERYAYLSGSNLDARLRHNLVSITAPNDVASGGPPRLRIEYETNTRSPNFERVLSQTIGGTNQTGVPAGGTISYEFQSLGTAPANDFITPVAQTTVTDRNGNLTEYQFNRLGNIVRVREFANRDIRPGDPEFFETRYEYNQDGEVLRIIHPEGNSTEYVYDSQNSDRFQQGNILREIRRHPELHARMIFGTDYLLSCFAYPALLLGRVSGYTELLSIKNPFDRHFRLLRLCGLPQPTPLIH